MAGGSIVRRVLPIALLAVAAGTAVIPQSEAAFPGHNGLIAYFDGASGREGLWTVNPTTGHRHRLTTQYQDQSPDFSPDGAWILFGQAGKIALIRPDGTHEHILARPTNGAAGPAWSPDGQHIVYTAGVFHSDGRQPLHVMRADGTHDHSLDVEAGCAAWSPDGSWMTATISRHYVSHIVRLRPDGSHVRTLTQYRGDGVSSDGLGEACADWAPDGRHLAYSRAWSDAAGHFHFAVFVMRPDGSHDHAITQRWSGQPDLYGVAYSPNGKRITFAHDGHVFVIDVDGGHRRRLTSATGEAASELTWQPS